MFNLPASLLEEEKGITPVEVKPLLVDCLMVIRIISPFIEVLF